MDFSLIEKVLLSGWIKDARLGSSIAPEDQKDDVLLPLSNEEVGRLRYRVQHKPTIYDKLGPRWAPAFQLYSDTLPVSAKSIFNRLMMEAEIHKYKSDKALRNTLSELTTLAKKNGNDGQVAIDFKYLVNLENFGAFQPEVVDDLDEVAQEWVSKKDFPEWYNDIFETAMDKVVNEITTNIITKPLSVEEFLNSKELWTTPGGTSDKLQLYISVNNEEGKMQKTKLTTAMMNSPVQLKQWMYSWKKQVNVLNAKREATKMRAIISSDIELYLKMAYISYFLDQMFISDKSFLFTKGSKKNYELWQKLCASSANVKFPFDQSGFDQHVSLKMVTSALKSIKRILKESNVNEEVIEIMDRIMYAMDGGHIQLKSGKLVVIEGGVLSGWRWTALLDTIINMAQLKAYEIWSMKYRNKNVSGAIYDSVFFGDDISMSLLSKKYAVEYFSFMKELRYGVNPKKIFVDRGRDEFLRKVITLKGTIGYPARVVNSILWRSPDTREPKKGELRANEQVSIWITYISRGMSKQNCYKHMIIDLMNGNKLSKVQVKRLLSTPKSAGGLGLMLDFNDDWSRFDRTENKNVKFSYFKTKNEAVRQTNNIIEFEGLKYNNEYWGVNYMPKPADLGNWNIDVQEKDFIVKEVPNMERWKILTRWKMAYNSADMMPMSIDRGTLKPQWNIDVPRFWIAGYVSEIINGKMTNEEIKNDIEGKLENKAISDRIYYRCGKRVWIEWVLDRLPFKQPLHYRYDDLQISQVYEPILNYFWNKRILKNTSYSDVLNLAILVELKVQSILDGIFSGVAHLGR